MVKQASRPALLPFMLLAVLLLPGCRFFTSSFFPGYLAQVEKSWDLESEIDTFLAIQGSSEYAMHPSVFVLTASTSEDYGGLLIELDGLSEKLLFMAGPSGGAQQLAGQNFSQLHFMNAGGSFVVGSLFFPPGNLSSWDDSLMARDGRAYWDGSTHYRLWTDNSDILSYQTLTINPTPPWSGGGTNTIQIDSVTGYDLRGAWYDPLASGNPLALVFFNGNMNRVYVFRVPSLPSASPPFTTNYPPVSFENMDPSRVVYTRKGIVVVEDRTATLMDFNGGETDKRLNLGEGGEKQLAFDIEGDVFYVFDPETKTLYRGKTGW